MFRRRIAALLTLPALLSLATGCTRTVQLDPASNLESRPLPKNTTIIMKDGKWIESRAAVIQDSTVVVSRVLVHEEEVDVNPPRVLALRDIESITTREHDRAMEILIVVSVLGVIALMVAAIAGGETSFSVPTGGI
ncbi:MAG TPA: hypothetical protein VFX92_00125 [Candidatus Krumholzibacteria bacterium]|nr:hypothetical protein [Candidatus Krumholzibacteria bacterium]